MSCRRTGPKRRLLRYLEGDLPVGKAERLEKHLFRCPECRAEIARLRTAGAAVRGLCVAEADPANAKAPGISEILSGPDEPFSGVGGWLRRWEIRFAALATPKAVLMLALVVLMLFIAVLAGNRAFFGGGRDFSSFRAWISAAGEFHPLSVSEVAANTRPRISVEGIVHEILFDPKEKILRFKLIGKPSEPEPFVVCEILDSASLPAVREGDRVRVYGIARFDPQPGREWHEVNPVLNMTVIKD